MEELANFEGCPASEEAHGAAPGHDNVHAMPQRDKAGPAAALAANRPRILLAEGDPMVARDIRRQLLALDYEPLGPAVQGDEAIAMTAALCPALVLVDTQLTGPMDGVATAQQIRRRFGLPVVFIAALAAHDALERVQLAEPFGYVLKPFSDRELRIVLAMALYKHRAEGQLRASEQKFRSIFEAEPECVKMLSLDGALLEMNAAGLAMLDADSVEQVQAHGLTRFVHPAHVASFVALCGNVAQGASGLLEFQTTGLRGTQRWLETHATPLRDQNGTVIAVLGVTRDITGRKQNQLQRRVSNRILGAVSQGVVVCNANRLIETVNAAFTAITGYTEAEVVGRNCRFLQGENTNPDTLALLRAALCATTVFEAELLNYRKDGTEFWNELTISPVLGDDGQLSHFVGVLREVTARKWAEEALRDTTHQLRRLSQQVLTAQETERRRMAHELHDELGQALTAIKINLQTRSRLQGPSPHGIDQENLRILDEALQQVRRLALALRPSMLDDLGLGPALRWLTEQTAARSGLVVSLVVPVLEPRLAPDLETACFRIVQEALTNIVRHAGAKHVGIDLRHDQHMLTLAVEDDGCGFDPAEVQVRALGGASLGLLGMRERAILVGGQLDFDARPGHGTKTVLRCPLRWQGDAV